MRAVKVWTWRRALRDHGPDQQGLLLTLYTLSTYMDDDGFAYPGQQAIADGARASVRTIRRHLSKARDLGWLYFKSRHTGGKRWRRYEYQAAVPDDVPLSEKDDELTTTVQADWDEMPEGVRDALH